MNPITVLLVDDHELVRLGLRTLIDDQPNMRVVGEAGTAADALYAVECLHPDVVLMDIRIPGKGGIEATQEITRRFPGSQVIMLTSFADDELVVRAILAGARGYVLKQVGNAELLRGINAVARGEALLDPATTARLLGHVRATEQKLEQDAFRDLSPRELQVLEEIAQGKTNSEIGKALYLSEGTIRNYISTILDKLKVSNRIELAGYALEHHIFERRGR